MNQSFKILNRLKLRSMTAKKTTRDQNNKFKDKIP